MKNYHTCPHCGATLDYAGPCECIQQMYSTLSPEKRRKVGDLVDRLLEEQSETKEAVSKLDTPRNRRS